MTKLKRYTHSDDGIVYACPHCDATELRKRWQNDDPRGRAAEIDPDAPLVCYSCKRGVYDATERESRSGSPEFQNNSGTRSAKHGPAVDLEAMDPPSEDEWDDIVAAARGD